jgi:hypothetical protein
MSDVARWPADRIRSKDPPNDRRFLLDNLQLPGVAENSAIARKRGHQHGDHRGLRPPFRGALFWRHRLAASTTQSGFPKKILAPDHFWRKAVVDFV